MVAIEDLIEKVAFEKKYEGSAITTWLHPVPFLLGISLARVSAFSS